MARFGASSTRRAWRTRACRTSRCCGAFRSLPTMPPKASIRSSSSCAGAASSRSTTRLWSASPQTSAKERCGGRCSVSHIAPSRPTPSQTCSPTKGKRPRRCSGGYRGSRPSSASTTRRRVRTQARGSRVRCRRSSTPTAVSATQTLRSSTPRLASRATPRRSAPRSPPPSPTGAKQRGRSPSSASRASSHDRRRPFDQPSRGVVSNNDLLVDRATWALRVAPSRPRGFGQLLAQHRRRRRAAELMRGARVLDGLEVVHLAPEVPAPVTPPDHADPRHARDLDVSRRRAAGRRLWRKQLGLEHVVGEDGARPERRRDVFKVCAVRERPDFVAARLVRPRREEVDAPPFHKLQVRR
mmetsp:Transcript_19944/g.67534  ORF Transcript_19944/g.67534 Transcript_19944/m.67534 type:complete len:355 (-) Transcript_19944:270-1334(-)